MKPKQKSDELKNMKIIVVGAGPGGLTFARGASNSGAEVTVLEQAGDPRGKDAGYTNRSFNLTLNNVGRAVLGDERAWRGGVNLVGRAVHNFGGSQDIKYASFGEDSQMQLTSVPRPTLRKNLVAITEETGVNLQFRCKVTNVDPNSGIVEYDNDGLAQSESADLVVIADGVHSMGDKIVLNQGGSTKLRIEELRYVTVLLDAQTCRDMSSHHIHFWHEADRGSVAIGLPNKDGSIAALMISKYKGVAIDVSPFPDQDTTASFLASDFPQLLSLDKNLGQKVLGRKAGRFYYKSITIYILGERCVVVGDAGSAAPPWAGFGANTAIYSADALVRFMIGSKNLQEALQGYDEHKRILAEKVLEFAFEHGEFLSDEVTKHPEQRSIGPVLARLVNESIELSHIPPGVQLLNLH